MTRRLAWLTITKVGLLTLVVCNVNLFASQLPKVNLDAFFQRGVTRDVMLAKPEKSGSQGWDGRYGIRKQDPIDLQDWRLWEIALEQAVFFNHY